MVADGPPLKNPRPEINTLVFTEENFGYQRNLSTLRRCPLQGKEDC